MTKPLHARGLTKRFCGIVALDVVDIDVDAGGRAALIGPKGAGKTTCLNCIVGVLPVREGTVELAGRDVSRLLCVLAVPSSRCQASIVPRTPPSRRRCGKQQAGQTCALADRVTILGHGAIAWTGQSQDAMAVVHHSFDSASLAVLA